MSAPLEREVKLRFDSPGAARTAILATGATPLRPRRLQQDALFDTADGQLRASRSALRVRSEPGACFVTFKGAPQPSSLKLREELETSVGDASTTIVILERLGFRVWFRYEKYREEFAGDGATLAIDETPIGTFVEIEGTEAGIVAAVSALGRTSADYIVDSYRALFVRECAERGVAPGDMLFNG
jgi:adenylate cyclase class 2